MPRAKPHVLCSYGHLHPPAGRRNPAHLDPLEPASCVPRPPNSPGDTGVTCLGRSREKGAYADAGRLGFPDTHCSRQTGATVLPRLGWIGSLSPRTGSRQGPLGLRRCQGPWRSSSRPAVPTGHHPSLHQCHPGGTLRALRFPLEPGQWRSAAVVQDTDRRGGHRLGGPVSPAALTESPRAGSLKCQKGFSQVLQVRTPGSRRLAVLNPSQVTPHLPRVLAVSPVPGFQKRPHHSAVMVTGVLLCVCIHAPLLSLNLSCWIRGPLTPGLIQRWLPLGRKAMTSLDSILKSRDITLPTKFCIVKPMVFPGVMYGCESWTIKKAKC